MTINQIDDAMLYEAWMSAEAARPKPAASPDAMWRSWNSFRRSHAPTDWQIPDPKVCEFWPYRPDGWREN